MDRETHPNAVYKYDAHTQTIYPVDKQTNQPLSEISKLVMSKQKQQQNIPNKGMIRNVRKALVVESLQGTLGKTDEFLEVKGEDKKQQAVPRYFADFVIDVFVVPDEKETVENVREKLDKWLIITNTSNELAPHEAYLKRREDEVKNIVLGEFLRDKTVTETFDDLDPDEKKELYKDQQDRLDAVKIKTEEEYILLKKSFDEKIKYIDDKGSSTHYVEKIKDTVNVENDIWVIHPEFDTLRLPFNIVRNRAGVDDETHLVHLHMKLNLKVMSRYDAYQAIKYNDTMSNFYVFLVNDLAIKPNPASRSSTIYSRSVFYTNLVVMSSDQLSSIHENLFIHEIGHSLFKYDDPLIDGILIEYGEHNKFELPSGSDEPSYMGLPGGVKEFTANDLMALSIPSKNKAYHGGNSVIYSKTYGEMVDEVFGNKSRKNDIAENMMYIEEKMLSYEIKDEYLKVFKNEEKKIREELFIFEMLIKQEDPTKGLKMALNNKEKLRIYNIRLEKEINCQGSGICNDFVFYNKFVDGLVDNTINSMDDFKKKYPKNTWPKPPKKDK